MKKYELISFLKKDLNKHLDLFLDAVMLTGSYADETNTDKSDVDVVILNKKINRTVIIDKFIQGLRFQFIIIPYYKVNMIFLNDFFERRYPLITMIRKGIIIKDTSDKTLLNLQKLFLSKKDTYLSDHDILAIRNKITGMLCLVDEKNPSIEDNIHLLIDLLRYGTYLAVGNSKAGGKRLDKIVTEDCITR